jgi:ribosomal protein L37AE/L43A
MDYLDELQDIDDNDLNWLFDDEDEIPHLIKSEERCPECHSKVVKCVSTGDVWCSRCDWVE